MKLRIKKPKYTNKYELVVEWMLGDADGEVIQSFYFDGDDKALELMKALKKLYNGRFYEPKEMDEDGRFFTGVSIVDEIFKDEYNERFWPTDLDDESPAHMEKYNLYYYDEQGKRVEVELVK